MKQPDTVIKQEDMAGFNRDLSRSIPETVRNAWGEEVAADFVSWLASLLRDTLQLITDSSPHIQVTSAYARRKVNRLMLDRVSYLLLAGEPTLIHTDRWYWRVPIDLTFPSRGRVGCVGEVDVDTALGQVKVTDELLSQIARQADRLAQKVLESSSAENA